MNYAKDRVILGIFERAVYTAHKRSCLKGTIHLVADFEAIGGGEEEEEEEEKEVITDLAQEKLTPVRGSKVHSQALVNTSLLTSCS